MQPSQRLYYELSLIRSVEQCSSLSEEVQKSLSPVIENKRSELHLAFSNAVWGSGDADAFFSFANGVFDMTPSGSDYSELQEALRYFDTLGEQLSQAPELDEDELESQFQAVFESGYAGKLLQSIALLERYLGQIALTLNKVDIPEGFCGGPFVFMRAQMEQYYLLRLQPFMARMNRSAYPILNSMESIQESSRLDSAEWSDFIRQFSVRDQTSLWNRYQLASRRHAQAWSRLIDICRSKGD